MRRNKSLIKTKQTNKKRLWGWWFNSIGRMPPLGSILPPQKSGTGVYALNAITELEAGQSEPQDHECL